MIDWVLDAMIDSEISSAAVVVGNCKEAVIEHLGDKVCYCEQKERLGTGHAVMQAKDFILNSGAEDVVVLCGDAPFISSQVLDESYLFHKQNNNGVTVITACLDNPTGYGRIVRSKSGDIDAIVEEKDATEDIKKIKEINSGAYWFSIKALVNSYANHLPSYVLIYCSLLPYLQH